MCLYRIQESEGRGESRRLITVIQCDNNDVKRVGRGVFETEDNKRLRLDSFEKKTVHYHTHQSMMTLHPSVSASS